MVDMKNTFDGMRFKMKKILFLIHDLGHGGAEKVLVNLVNNMNPKKFDITVMTLFDVGVNRQFLAPHVTYKSCFSKMPPGNSKMMKVLTPEQLHNWLIKEHYDIEVAYLEGPSARVISGCRDNNTKLVCWIHIEQKTTDRAAASFRSKREAEGCYNRFDKIITVSETVKSDFTSLLSIQKPVEVLYNTNETEKIIDLSKENVENNLFRADTFNIIGVGKLLKSKGFDRLFRIQKKLLEEGYNVNVYILGEGPEFTALKRDAKENGMEKRFILLGYQTNPYKFVSKSDLFVCASFAEGFSTAATEALVVGTPVCTVEVSGMKEMLGNNTYGLITENDDKALYQGIKRLMDDDSLLEYYRKQAVVRGKMFSTEKTVKAVENMLFSLK